MKATTFAIFALIFALVGPTPLAAVTLKPGDLIVADYAIAGPFDSAGVIVKFDPQTGLQSNIYASGGFFGGGNFAPRGVAIAADSQIYSSEPGISGITANISRIDPATGVRTTVSSAGNLAYPYGITFGPDGYLYVADEAAFGGSGGIIKVNPSTGQQTTVSSGGSFVDPIGIHFEPSGNIVVSDITANSVFRIDPVSGAQTLVASSLGVGSPEDITVASNGDIFVTAFTEFVGIGDYYRGVVKVDPGSGNQTVPFSGTSFSDPKALAISGDNHLFFWSPAGMLTLNLGNNNLTQLGGSFQSPYGMAIVVPEPGVPTLLAMGSLGLWLFQPHKRRRSSR